MAAAVFDVNKDGKLDIVCGGWWYEAPTWKKHFLRKVEMQGGRPDGYAHQLLDVNGDGWLDLVTVNWRTSSIKWIEHPGAAGLARDQEWKAHTIATPGSSETGRLVDLLGDGTPCLLPAGAGFAAWWELKRTPDLNGAVKVEWIRHALPKELAGHGQGVGDINGDGRMDIVGRNGWAEAPQDRRNGRWIWHPDFDLDQASIPILVADVDGDGLNDIIWTRGHDYGMYWLQQSRTKSGAITWTKHTIDTSIPGCHAPLWEDMDGDGVKELVVGRRYLAHEGKDPGEYDPQSGYRFQYDKKTRTWRQHLITWNDDICFGLDPKAVDVTGSGRTDLVCGGRHGLYWLENLGNGSTVAKGLTKDPLWFPSYRDHFNLMIVKDPKGKEKPVKTAFDWGQRRAQILAAAQNVLGVLPDSYQRVPLDVKVLSEEPIDRYVRKKITFGSDLGSRVSAYLLVPKNVQKGAPAMICQCDDTPFGKDGDSMKCAHELAQRGFVCLAPDSPPLKKNSELYASSAMKAVWDNIRAIDLLETMPEVNNRRIGIIGHGLGGQNALLTAAFDYRLAGVVSSCGFTAFANHKQEHMASLGMPKLKEVYKNDPAKIPFDFSELIATIAPRNVLVIAPLHDKVMDVEGVKRAVAGAAAVYDMRRAGKSLQAIYPDNSRRTFAGPRWPDGSLHHGSMNAASSVDGAIAMHWQRLLLCKAQAISVGTPVLSHDVGDSMTADPVTASAHSISSIADGLRLWLAGQNKDQKTKGYQVPAAPALSAADEMKTFKIAPGYRVELVAAEPLVHDPVAMTFDPDGRIWVCEMRGYMPNVDGKGQKVPVGTISVLEDTDGDGVMDKSTVFLDQLILPRAVCWTADGLLVAENGKVWLCKSRANGLKCDDKKLVMEYNQGNSEHSLNGLVPMLDNWIYAAKEGIRLRKLDGKWVREATAPRGQWGIAQDDHGYLVYTVNASLIRGDLTPCYSPNAHAANPMLNLALYKEQQVWPIRPNPGINRGYLASFLRPDGTMIEANANCGPVVYRGDNLPKELLGNVFINEPAGNLVRRQVFTQTGDVKSSKNAYDKAEFLASTDERFRPVNLYNAPDGTLYLIDMYRGIIQEGAYITPHLRQQILERGLDKPIGLGRIFRIAHESTEPRKRPALGKATSADLVSHLASPNGWRRDMAQQLLVQRGDRSVISALEELAAKSPLPLARLHALWTLEGLGKLDTDMLLTLVADKDRHVRASAVCLLRKEINRYAEPTYLQELAPRAQDSDKIVRVQLALTLGLVNTAQADRVLEPILKEAAADPLLLQSILAGFVGQEAEFLAARLPLPSWAKPEPWREKLLATSAGVFWRQRQPLAVLRFQHLVGSQTEDRAWQQLALLEGLSSMPVKAVKGSGVGKVKLPPKVVTLPTAPEALEKLRKSPHARLAAAAEAMAKQLNWPGKDGKPLPVVPPLSAKHQALYDLGRKEYMALCAACHHPAGYGDTAKGPALLDSEWLDNDERLVRLVLLGLRGPISINGEPFNRDGAMEMPGTYKLLDDEKLAGILTFVRREWRESARPIEPTTVARIRASTSARTDQWTEKELLQVK